MKKERKKERKTESVSPNWPERKRNNATQRNNGVRRGMLLIMADYDDPIPRFQGASRYFR